MKEDGYVFVLHRDGWCATNKTTTQYADQVETLCGHFVIGPYSLMKSTFKAREIEAARGSSPTCVECKKWVK